MRLSAHTVLAMGERDARWRPRDHTHLHICQTHGLDSTLRLRTYSYPHLSNPASEVLEDMVSAANA